MTSRARSKTGNIIWSRPSSKEFRDHYDGIFRKPSVVGGDLADEAAPHMAARVAKEIDEAVVVDTYDDKFAGLRKKMADDVPVAKMHDDLRDHAEWLWGKFIDKLAGGPEAHFVGSVDAYKKLFMRGTDRVAD